MGNARAIKALRAFSVLLLAAGAIGAVVVGGSTKHATAQQVATIRGTADAVPAQGTVVIKYQFTFSGAGQQIGFDGEEHQDFANRRSTGAIRLPAPLGTMTAVGNGDSTWLQLDAIKGPSGDRGWWRVDVEPGVIDKPEYALSGAPNGIDYLAYLRHIADKVTDEGTATINGVGVRHYRATVDLARALQQQGADQQQEQLRMLQQQGIEFDAVADVFIDDAGLPHRLAIKISASGFTFELELDFVDYGSPVDVVLPPDDAVVRTFTISSAADMVTLGMELGQLLRPGG